MGEFEFEAKLPKSLPCVKGGGAACRDGGIVKQSIVPIPHPLCGSPLCTRGPYICANKEPNKSKFERTRYWSGIAGGASPSPTSLCKHCARQIKICTFFPSVEIPFLKAFGKGPRENLAITAKRYIDVLAKGEDSWHKRFSLAAPTNQNLKILVSTKSGTFE